MLKESYKIARHDDDVNQPLSVQAWGVDGRKRVYWLIEGQDDTSFRVYAEYNYKKKDGNAWRSVAGSIDELRLLTEQLSADGAQSARRLVDRINNAIPRFEATEEVRQLLAGTPGYIC